MIGEVLVTCEKLTWLADHGKQYLQREYRDTGRMMMMKRVYVDYIPLGITPAYSLTYLPTHSLTLLTHLLTHLTHSLTHLLNHSPYLLTHSFIQV